MASRFNILSRDGRPYVPRENYSGAGVLTRDGVPTTSQQNYGGANTFDRAPDRTYPSPVVPRMSEDDRNSPFLVHGNDTQQQTVAELEGTGATAQNVENFLAQIKAWGDARSEDGILDQFNHGNVGNPIINIPQDVLMADPQYRAYTDQLANLDEQLVRLSQSNDVMGHTFRDVDGRLAGQTGAADALAAGNAAATTIAGNTEQAVGDINAGYDAAARNADRVIASMDADSAARASVAGTVTEFQDEFVNQVEAAGASQQDVARAAGAAAAAVADAAGATDEKERIGIEEQAKAGFIAAVRVSSQIRSNVKKERDNIEQNIKDQTFAARVKRDMPIEDVDWAEKSWSEDWVRDKAKQYDLATDDATSWTGDDYNNVVAFISDSLASSGYGDPASFRSAINARAVALLPSTATDDLVAAGLTRDDVFYDGEKFVLAASMGPIPMEDENTMLSALNDKYLNDVQNSLKLINDMYVRGQTAIELRSKVLNNNTKFDVGSTELSTLISEAASRIGYSDEEIYNTYTNPYMLGLYQLRNPSGRVNNARNAGVGLFNLPEHVYTTYGFDPEKHSATDDAQVFLMWIDDTYGGDYELAYNSEVGN